MPADCRSVHDTILPEHEHKRVRLDKYLFAEEFYDDNKWDHCDENAEDLEIAPGKPVFKLELKEKRRSSERNWATLRL